MPVLQAHVLQGIARDIFVAAGVPPEEARIVADALVASNLAGHDSHGVIRVPQYLQLLRDGLIQPGQPTEIVRETPTTAVIDGHWNFGQVAARRATEIALAKAEAQGLGAVALHHANHVGRVGDYVLMAAERGFLGLAAVNNHGAAPHVAPFGGTAGRLSTNPIAFAAPTSSGPPFVLDMTTSIVAEGKIRVLRNQGKPIPEGWVLDGHGQPTTDPHAFYGPPKGALLPFGGKLGHKGFGLSLMVELLAGALSGAGCSRPGVTRLGNALFLLALKVESFLPLAEFERHLEALRTHVKDTPTQPGFDEILVPGEPEARTEARRRAEGIPLDDETWRQVLEAARSVGCKWHSTAFRA